MPTVALRAAPCVLAAGLAGLILALAGADAAAEAGLGAG